MDTINQYVYRGQKPKPLPQAGPKRISTPAGQRLSTILETGSNAGSNRLSAFSLTNMGGMRSEHHGQPPRHSEEKRPPSYETQNSAAAAGGVGGADGDGAGRLPSRPARYFARRGGWGRLALIVVLAVVVLAIALGVGIGVGLAKHSTSSNDSGGGSGGGSDPTPSGVPSAQGPFPVGSYGIDAYLTNTSTACTSNASTWLCYPYTTYAADAAGSSVVFDWYITQSPDNSSAYLISANASPQSIAFTNATLDLVDAGTPAERYVFTVADLLKTVLPAVSLTSDGLRATCFYNTTTFEASLYTRRNGTLQASASASNSASLGRRGGWGGSVGRPTGQSLAAFDSAWPGAVTVQQVADGGDDVPNCYRVVDGQVSGDVIPLATEPSTDQCSCVYSN